MGIFKLAEKSLEMGCGKKFNYCYEDETNDAKRILPREQAFFFNIPETHTSFWQK